MPRVPRYTIDALRELDRQLAYAPPATRARHLKAAESLIGDLDLDRNYPEDYIVFRITGYRSDDRDPATLVGQALVRDLSTLITSLSDKLELEAGDDRPALSMRDAAEHLGVSEKTIHRYRRQGLVCHYLRDGEGSKRLHCYVDQLDAFAARHAARARHARSFTRIDRESVDRIVADARALREAEGVSLNEAARRLAERLGRAHETIRNLLQRHDDAADDPIFRSPGPLTDRQIRLVGRAWRWDVPVVQLIGRFGRTRPTMHRAINTDRARRLAELDLTWIELPTFEREDAGEVILTPPIVATGYVDPPEASHALRLINWARTAAGLGDADEDAVLAAYNMLKRRAAHGIAALGAHPVSRELDRIETDLRWAALLKRRLVFQGLASAIVAIERVIGRRLNTQPAEFMVECIERAFACSGDAAESVDPSRDQRVARRTAFLMDRNLAAKPIRPSRRRADARHIEGTITLPRLAHATVGWRALVELPDAWLDHVASLQGDQMAAITRRYGLAGHAPVTIEQLGAVIGLKRLATLNLLATARRALRQSAVEQPCT